MRHCCGLLLEGLIHVQRHLRHHERGSGLGFRVQGLGLRVSGLGFLTDTVGLQPLKSKGAPIRNPLARRTEERVRK